MGITKQEHLAVHPLRGHLFENLVVLEAMKALHNRGEKPNLHFYRDASKNEADLVLDNEGSLRLLEIKSAQTVASDAMKAALRVRGLMGERVSGLGLVYAGDEYQRRSEFEVLPYRGIGEWV